MKLLKEPLIHFLLIGAALFLLQGLFGEKEQDGDRSVIVSEGRINQLAALYLKTWQRPPTSNELKALVDDFVLEEIYYREARTMGIDQDDTMIRRRLRQKLEFLTEEIALPEQASDEQLTVFLDKNPERFRSDRKISFEQLYFNPAKLGDQPREEVLTNLDALRAGESVDGHNTLLASSFEEAGSRTIDGTFGNDFALKLAELKKGTWDGPVESGFGLHLVRVTEMTEGSTPPLEKIRKAVEREWRFERLTQAREAFDQALIERYEITVEWPELQAEPEG